MPAPRRGGTGKCYTFVLPGEGSFSKGMAVMGVTTPLTRNWDGEVWQNLLNTRLNWEKLVKPQLVVISAIFMSVYSNGC